MNKNEVINQILDVLQNILFVPKEILVTENFGLPLTGEIFNLSDISLTYLFLELRKRINFSMNEKQICNDAFGCVNSICSYILENA